MTVASKGTLFEPALVKDLIKKVQGKSSLAKLSKRKPIPFNGLKEFIFTMDSEVDIVAENGAKGHGGISLDPVSIIPIKFEYGARVSDEFLYATEEEKIDILEAFNEGFATKLAKGLDIAAMHGINPRTTNASSVVGDNHFDAKVTQAVEYEAANIEGNIEACIAMINGSEGSAVTGIVVSPAGRTALASLKNSAEERLYPELAWGGNPDKLNGLGFDSNVTVSVGNKDNAIIGDFEEKFKWGYGKDITLEVIKYGDPDNSGKDLKGHNQVYLRGEAYLGWGILDPNSFARIEITA